jgi:ABC-type multidrug transport system ATPase subunit
MTLHRHEHGGDGSGKVGAGRAVIGEGGGSSSEVSTGANGPKHSTSSNVLLKGTMADPQFITSDITNTLETEDAKPCTKDDIGLTTRTTGSATTVATTTTTTTTTAPTVTKTVATTRTTKRLSTLLDQESKDRDLAFRKITVSTKPKKFPWMKRRQQAPRRILLDNITGTIPSRQVTALMGPSGSGKTSLLKVLTGRISHSRLDVSGQVLMDGYAVNPSNSLSVRREIAYVEQDASIPATCTPREAIYFSARLRLDKSLTTNDVDALVDETLTRLGLQSCADTTIGGGVLMGGVGLSGGEKKRTQCGIELVTKPGIIVLDEPTTGLDSFSAESFVGVLKRLARAGACVVLTIHQPPPTVVRELDCLILLTSGRLLYNGPMGGPLLEYLQQKGVPKPNDFNIADWILVSYDHPRALN